MISKIKNGISITGLQCKKTVSTFYTGILSAALLLLVKVPLALAGPLATQVTTPPCPDPKNPLQLCNPIRYPDITSFLLAILNVAIQYGALLIVFFLVYAGFQFVIAQGNSEKIADARKMLTWVVVGAFVLLGVYVIRAAICGTLRQLGVDITCTETFRPQ